MREGAARARGTMPKMAWKMAVGCIVNVVIEVSSSFAAQ